MARKNIVPELNKTLQEYLDEHIWGRKTTVSLVDAKDKYLQGGPPKLSQIISLAREPGSFYPKYIEKEDKHFFFTHTRIILCLKSRKRCWPNSGNLTVK